MCVCACAKPIRRWEEQEENQTARKRGEKTPLFVYALSLLSRSLFLSLSLSLSLALSLALSLSIYIYIYTRSESSDIGGSAVLLEAAGLFQVFVQLSLGRVLENQVHARLVVKVAVETQNVVVPQV